MKNEDLKELEKILDTTLSAHQRANWSNKAARKIIYKVIINKFKKYLERNDVN